MKKKSEKKLKQSEKVFFFFFLCNFSKLGSYIGLYQQRVGSFESIT